MKKILKLLLCFVLFFSFTFNVYANTNITNNANNINIKKENTTITGKYPVLSGITNRDFQEDVNKKIDSLVKSKLTSYSTKNTNKVEVTYDIIQDENIVSVMIYFKNMYTNEVVSYSVNLNAKTNKYVDINSYLGANGLNYVNKVVAYKANDMGITYKKVTSSTPFYIKNGNVYVVFGAGSLTFAQKGNIIFEVLSQNLDNFVIKQNDYYKKSGYNVKMVPLREPLEHFGYEMNWKDGTVTILKNKKFVSYLVINENRYSDKNNKIIRQLEFAPEIKNGKTYVPISYFSQILEMLFAVDSNENIVISSYKL